MLVLLIETATQVCSVSIATEDSIIICKESNTPNSHSSVINGLIRSAFDETQLTLTELTAISISKGPGSYTGLRIGLSTAKGLCYGLNIPLVSVSTLKAMAMGAIDLNPSAKATYVPLMDARRMEVYSAKYDSCGTLIKPPNPAIINAEFVAEHYSTGEFIFFGSGLEKCKPFLNRSNHIYLDSFETSSKFLFKPTITKLQNKQFEDKAYFEPDYLKEFYTPAKK